jgi:hypothetical protein
MRAFPIAALAGARVLALAAAVPAAGAVPLNLVSAQGTLQIQTSALSATGDGWKEAFRHY